MLLASNEWGARGATGHPMRHRVVPTINDYLAPNVNRPELGKPWLEQRLLPFRFLRIHVKLS